MRRAQRPARRAPGLPRLRRAPTLGAVAAFALLGATLAYWMLQWLAPAVAIAPAGSLLDYARSPDLAAARALFGDESAATAPSVASDIDVRVLGIASSGVRGSAVLVVASRGAKAYVVGDRIESGLQLVQIRDDVVILERNGVRIELPAPRRPSIALLSGGPNAQGAPATAGAGAADMASEPGAADPTAPDSFAARLSPGTMPSRGADLPGSVGLVDPAAGAVMLSPRAPTGVDPSGMPGVRGTSTRSIAPAQR